MNGHVSMSIWRINLRFIDVVQLGAVFFGVFLLAKWFNFLNRATLALAGSLAASSVFARYRFFATAPSQNYPEGHSPRRLWTIWASCGL